MYSKSSIISRRLPIEAAFGHNTVFTGYLGRARQAVLYIRTNFDRKLLLEKIAAAVSIDKYTLSREFREVTGMTVVQYINSYRCKRAVEYIEDGNTVSEAARLCGFQNMSFL